MMNDDLRLEVDQIKSALAAISSCLLEIAPNSTNVQIVEYLVDNLNRKIVRLANGRLAYVEEEKNDEILETHLPVD